MAIPQTPSPLTQIVLSSTYNAAWYSSTSKEAAISTAIAAAAADGAKFVFIPTVMLPYNAALVTFNNAVRLIREGGNFAEYDVVAYGAAGDGVTDDTAECNAAISAALSNPGSIVRFPPGRTYLVSVQPNGAALLATGSNCLIDATGATIKLATTTTPTYGIFLGDLNNVVQYRRLRVIGGTWDANGSTDAKMIRGGWLDDVLITGAEVKNIACVNGGIGISVVGASSTNLSKRVKITKNYVHDFTGTPTSSDAIICQNTTGARMVHNHATNTGRCCFFFGFNTNGVISWNHGDALLDNGLRISTVNGGLFTDNSGHIVSDNTINGTTIDGIRLDGVHITCGRNSVLNAGQRGIKADLLQFSVISDNTIDSAGLEGIMLAKALAVEYNGSHTRNIISDNDVSNCGGAGIRIQGAGFDGTFVAFGNKVCDNYCVHNTIGGLEFESNDDLLIQDNILEENTLPGSVADKQGIFIDMPDALSSTHGIIIQGNKAWELRSVGGGLNFRQTKACRILCTNAGATLNGVVIRDNDFSNSPTNGVEVPNPTGTLGSVRIERNMVYGAANPIVCRNIDTGQGNIGTQGLKDFSGDRGDASVTCIATVDEPIQRFNTALTQARTCTLQNTSDATVGVTFRVVRTVNATGAFNLTVQDSTPATIKVLATAGNWVDVTWDGAAWRETASGSL